MRRQKYPLNNLLSHVCSHICFPTDHWAYSAVSAVRGLPHSLIFTTRHFTTTLDYLHPEPVNRKMSGFEVVGVVLGVLPLAIEALKTYKSTLSSMRNVERSLKALIQDLETEQVRLRTTCEVLLEGIVPLSMIDTLLETPFGPQWELYDHQLRLRLWTSSAKFQEQVAEMQKAAEELKNNLSIQAAGKGVSLNHLHYDSLVL